VPTSSMMPVNI